MLAAQRVYTHDPTRLLVSLGADTKISDKNGNTGNLGRGSCYYYWFQPLLPFHPALHHAAESGNFYAVQSLCIGGAPLTGQNSEVGE